MNMYEYGIEINFPLGIRKGFMIVYEDDGMLQGLLELFGSSKPFHGTLQENGTCDITGSMVTLTNTMRYHANGFMNSEWIKLDVAIQKEKYHLEGKRSRNEKIL